MGVQIERIFGTTTKIAWRRWQRLSMVQQDVLWLLLDGLRNGEISQELRLTPKQVEWNRSRIYEMMGSDSLAIISRMVALLELEGLVQR